SFSRIILCILFTLSDSVYITVPLHLKSIVDLLLVLFIISQKKKERI
uniref:Uncharacterized protein n=1 Tax=Amphimedon queenslandica TaxID=400682 RepID=A0A1X7TJP9_AMPQE